MIVFQIVSAVCSVALLVLMIVFLNRLHRLVKKEKQRKEEEKRRTWEPKEDKKSLFFTWLIRVKGVQDPYVRLYAYMYEGDVDGAQEFIENTPDLDMLVTESSIIEKYSNEYAEFLFGSPGS